MYPLVGLNKGPSLVSLCLGDWFAWFAFGLGQCVYVSPRGVIETTLPGEVELYKTMQLP